jgi:alpha-1,3-rhamnosyl/mannosyltransferase
MSGFEDVLDTAQYQLLPFAWEVENFSYKQPMRSLKTLYRDVVWSTICAPRKLKQLDADVYHDTASMPVTCPPGIPRVSTFLDASAFVYPERFRVWQRWRNPRRLQKTVAAARVIAISQFSADEAMRFLDIPSDRIEVIYLGSDFANPNRPIKEVVPEQRLPPEYFLFVGSLEPVKNLVLLRDVWNLAKRSGIQLPPLVVVGARWLGVRDEGESPAEWQYLGYISDEMLLYLMKRSLGLLFPSKYEGFGLPVLGAMSVGCPVISSRAGSLPEVGGDAVLYADLNPDAFLRVVSDLMKNDTKRSEIIEAGIARSRQFTWNRCASETLAVYKSVCG